MKVAKRKFMLGERVKVWRPRLNHHGKPAIVVRHCHCDQRMYDVRFDDGWLWLAMERELRTEKS
jgi:hypothetical protein